MLVQSSHKNSKSLEIQLEEKSLEVPFPNSPFSKESYETPISSKEKNKMELVWKVQRDRVKGKRTISPANSRSS
jgi:hypothetical protein